MLNDIESIQALCSEFSARLCLDCISSIGTLPLNLSDVFLASASSGKGLRSYPGVSMVFYNHELIPSMGRLPRYLDLGLYTANAGIPFTFSSNLLHALQASIRRVNWEERFSELAANSVWLRQSLEEAGFEVIGKSGRPSPAVITIALPQATSSQEIGQSMQESGYLLSCNSEYLRGHNWIQVCLMGECRREKLVSVLNTLKRVCQRQGILAAEPKLPNA
jgi:aspartate aminotransferase-like enzyme